MELSDTTTTTTIDKKKPKAPIVYRIPRPVEENEIINEKGDVVYKRELWFTDENDQTMDIVFELRKDRSKYLRELAISYNRARAELCEELDNDILYKFEYVLYILGQMDPYMSVSDEWFVKLARKVAVENPPKDIESKESMLDKSQWGKIENYSVFRGGEMDKLLNESRKLRVNTDEKQDDVEAHTKCFSCYKEISEEPKICSGCKIVTYCSQECQKTHWTVHRLACYRLDMPQVNIPSVKQIRMLQAVADVKARMKFLSLEDPIFKTWYEDLTQDGKDIPIVNYTIGEEPVFSRYIHPSKLKTAGSKEEWDSFIAERKKKPSIDLMFENEQDKQRYVQQFEELYKIPKVIVVRVMDPKYVDEEIDPTEKYQPIEYLYFTMPKIPKAPPLPKFQATKQNEKK